MDFIINLLKKNDINVIESNDTKTERRDGDIIYRDKSMFSDIISNGSLGAGESYIEGKWICHNNKIDVLVYKILKNNIEEQIKPKSWSLWFRLLGTYIYNYQTRKRCYDVEDTHYNLDNKLYEYMLGGSMAYTCAYFREGNDDLDLAQFDKFQLICNKIQLNENDNVLDMGCGFGTLAKFMVEKKGCNVVAINISKEQLKFANEAKDKMNDNLKNKLTYIDLDYRDIRGKFNKIVSIGLCEHIGYKNYRVFFEKVYDCLENGGIFLMHTIGNNLSVTCTDPWIDKYIFPGGMLPSIKQIGEAIEGLFVLEDIHNFGPDYDKTLQKWYHNYINARENGNIIKDDKFDKMWEFYLLSCAGNFRARKIQLWQFVFTKGREIKYTVSR